MSDTPPTIRWVEEFALSTDGWIKAFPLGEYKRGGRTLSITSDKVKRMEANFRNRVTDYDIPVNVEHLPQHGRVGVIKDMQARDDGLWVLPDDEARAFLQSRKFGYVSPEVVWTDYTNNQGVKADDVVVGLAATNTPYFGKSVALFSARGEFDKQELAMVDKQEEFAANAGLIETIGLWDKTLRAIRKYLPAEQAEEVEEAVSEAKEEAKKDDKKVEKASAAAGVDVEQFAAQVAAHVKAEVEAQYAEKYAAIQADNERLKATVAASEYKAKLAEMDKYAARLNGLPRVDKFSEHLLTWKTKLGAEEFAVLDATLKAASEAVKTSGLFSRQSNGQGVERSASDQFEAKVQKYKAENNVSYGEAFTAVGNAEPELYAQASGGQ